MPEETSEIRGYGAMQHGLYSQANREDSKIHDGQTGRLSFHLFRWSLGIISLALWVVVFWITITQIEANVFMQIQPLLQWFCLTGLLIFTVFAVFINILFNRSR